MLASRGVRFYVLGLVLLAVVACFLPLADHLGYELSELVALYAGLFGGAPGIAAMRRGRPLREALTLAIGALLLPVAIILLNGVRRPACDPVGGLVLYAAIAVPCALLAVCLGAACGRVRRAGLLYALVFAASLLVALWPVLRGPQVFVFHHLGGMYPGPIYDEAIRATPALWWFRLCTLLYAAGLAGIALRNWLVAALPVALIFSLQAERLHWKASESLLDAELGGVLKTSHLILHFPREKKPEERKLLALDAEAQWQGVHDFLGAGSGRVEVWLYRSADEKRRLIGAAETSFTKPWLRQIHTNDEPAPHHVLRHELVHALGADVAHGPWGVPGLVPNMALVEGIAVAGDWPPGEFTIHEETRALREIHRMPDVARLFKPGLFYAESGPVAYTTAGSFVRWLWETRGAQFVREAYAGQRPLGDLEQLAAEHLKFLDSLPRSERAVALAQQRFSAPAIVRKRCAHEVAGLQREAAAAAPPLSARLWERCVDLEPDDPALLLQLHRAQLAAGETAAAQATEARLLSHPKLSEPLRALALTEAGDAAWKAGDVVRAAGFYAQAGKLAQPEPNERALTVRELALADPPSWLALRRLLADADTGPDVLLELRDLDLARRDGLFAYLIAKQLQNRGAWAECAKYAQGALDRGLPGPLFVQEALRMRGIAAWHLGDVAAARICFSALGDPAPPGRALEAQRWLERL